MLVTKASKPRRSIALGTLVPAADIGVATGLCVVPGTSRSAAICNRVTNVSKSCKFTTSEAFCFPILHAAFAVASASSPALRSSSALRASSAFFCLSGSAFFLGFACYFCSLCCFSCFGFFFSFGFCFLFRFTLFLGLACRF